MRKIITCALVAASLAASGCANMTPEEKAALAGAAVGALAVGAVAAAAYRPAPVYVAPAPVYRAPVHTTCHRNPGPYGGTTHCVTR